MTYFLTSCYNRKTGVLSEQITIIEVWVSYQTNYYNRGVSYGCPIRTNYYNRGMGVLSEQMGVLSEQITVIEIWVSYQNKLL